MQQGLRPDHAGHCKNTIPYYISISDLTGRKYNFRTQDSDS
ncbi:Uncharacterized protein dnm_040510 [Desulfonema magnum]|uniref:Uncharacterized protein n=1 Tax=Desulfonema magnum TaxID=45655 RepID=A0A975BM62_9BACT|nr:Uncharacterized protein dnm_040510 [Desulfonema magnum]